MGSAIGGAVVDGVVAVADGAVVVTCCESASMSAHAENTNCEVTNSARTRRDDVTVDSELQNLFRNCGCVAQRVVVMIDDCITALTKNYW